MSDKAAFVRSVYSRYRAQTFNVNVISPAFKRLLLAESEFAFLISPVQVVIAASQSVWFTKQTYLACYKKWSTPEGLNYCYFFYLDVYWKLS